MAEKYAKYEYVCGSGHMIAGNTELFECPVATCKKPTLTRVGVRKTGDE